MSARSAKRFLERLLSDPEFGLELLDSARASKRWSDVLSREGYTCSIAELRELAGAPGDDELEPEIWLEAVVHSVTNP